MRQRIGQGVAVLLFALFAASWLLPDGLTLGSIRVGGSSLTYEVAPPLHEGTEWARYLAPEGTCGDDNDTAVTPEAQFAAMRCLLDWARLERGLSALTLDSRLTHSSQLKADEIVRCGDFSHTPCGTPFEATFREVGWQGSYAENIAWGASLASTPRVLVDGWLHSDGHRKSLFRPEWQAQGLAVARAETFEGEGPAAIWVHQFGAPP